MFGTLGIWEIMAILGVGLLIFGGKKLPALGKGLGEGIMNFKNSLKKGKEESSEEDKTDNEKGN